MRFWIISFSNCEKYDSLFHFGAPLDTQSFLYMKIKGKFVALTFFSPSSILYMYSSPAFPFMSKILKIVS